MLNDDYISRRNVMNAACSDCYCCETIDEFEDTTCPVKQKIMSIPAANVEPKRKSGRWIIAGAFDDFYQCPECGEMWPIFSTIEWKCCPICECKIITNRPKGETDEHKES